MPAPLLKKLPRPGLYLITPDGITADPDGLNKIRSLLTSSDCIALLQYRDKLANLKTQISFATHLQSICKAAAVPLIINDDAQLAASINAAGVHLGKDDTPYTEARSILGQQAIIGVSCYNDLERADLAAKAGADYLAFGCMFISKTKTKAIKCPLSILQQAKLRFSQPLVAIGGISAQNSRPVLVAGANYLAVISGVFSSDDPKARIAEYRYLFTQTEQA